MGSMRSNHGGKEETLSKKGNDGDPSKRRLTLPLCEDPNYRCVYSFHVIAFATAIEGMGWMAVEIDRETDEGEPSAPASGGADTTIVCKPYVRVVGPDARVLVRNPWG